MGTLYTVDDSGNLTFSGTLTGTVPQSQITGLVSALAGKAGSSVTLSAAGRLTGGGDLSTNRTFTQNIYDTYPQLITESTTARTLAIVDAQSIISCTNSGGTVTITVPTNASAAIPIGSTFRIKNATGSQLVNLAVAGGVTLLPQATIATVVTPISVSVGDGGEFEIKKDATDIWTVTRCYEQSVYTGTFGTGVLTTPVSRTFNITRDMNNIRMSIPSIKGPITSAGLITSPTAIAIRFRPIQTANTPARIDNNGTTQSTYGILIVSTGGILTGSLQANGSGTFQVNATGGGINEVQVDYNLI